MPTAISLCDILPTLFSNSSHFHSGFATLDALLPEGAFSFGDFVELRSASAAAMDDTRKLVLQIVIRFLCSSPLSDDGSPTTSSTLSSLSSSGGVGATTMAPPSIIRRLRHVHYVSTSPQHLHISLLLAHVMDYLSLHESLQQQPSRVEGGGTVGDVVVSSLDMHPAAVDSDEQHEEVAALRWLEKHFSVYHVQHTGHVQTVLQRIMQLDGQETVHQTLTATTTTVVSEAKSNGKEEVDQKLQQQRSNNNKRPRDEIATEEDIATSSRHPTTTVDKEESSSSQCATTHNKPTRAIMTEEHQRQQRGPVQRLIIIDNLVDVFNNPSLQLPKGFTTGAHFITQDFARSIRTLLRMMKGNLHQPLSNCAVITMNGLSGSSSSTSVTHNQNPPTVSASASATDGPLQRRCYGGPGWQSVPDVVLLTSIPPTNGNDYDRREQEEDVVKHDEQHVTLDVMVARGGRYAGDVSSVSF